MEKMDMEEQPGETRPAFTINFYSWATPIVGLVMLLIGLAGGYFGRPYLAGITSKGQDTAQVTAEAVTAPEQAPQSAEEMMTFLIGQVRHFKGNPDAKITLIEFSDFQ